MTQQFGNRTVHDFSEGEGIKAHAQRTGGEQRQNQEFARRDVREFFHVLVADIAEDDSDYRKFTDEFYKFREWYVIDSQVEVIPDNEDDPEDCQSLRDAITTARIDKLNGNNHRFNFEKGANYEVDGYTMSFAELAAIEDEEDL